MNPNPGSLTKHQQAVLEHIRKHQPIAMGALSKAFGCCTQTMSNHTRALRLAGLIQHEGLGRWTRWSVVKSQPQHTMAPIEQVSSVWHYARRCAQAA